MREIQNNWKDPASAMIDVEPPKSPERGEKKSKADELCEADMILRQNFHLAYPGMARHLFDVSEQPTNKDCTVPSFCEQRSEAVCATRWWSNRSLTGTNQYAKTRVERERSMCQVLLPDG